MRRAVVLVAVLLAASFAFSLTQPSLGSAGGDTQARTVVRTSQHHHRCTSRQFRPVARQVYQPWFKQIGHKWRLRKLKGCAQNDRTLRKMNSIQRGLARGRFKQIAYYHSLTPFEMGEPGFERSAIPPPCVYRETRGTYGAQRWTAENPTSGADGPYQLLDHGQPDAPVQGIHQKMAHHRIAHDLYVDYGLSPWGGSCY